MIWLNILLSDLDNEAFACAETADIGTWVRLMRYCCSQENGGIIKGAKSFDSRKIDVLFRLTKAEIHDKSALWGWKGNNLFVSHFPEEMFEKMKRKRASALKASNIRWGKHDPKSDSKTDPKSDSKTDPKSDSKTECESESIRKGKGKGNGNIIRKGNDKSKGKAPNGAHSTPPTLPEVISFFASLNASRELAEKFFHHYQANGWRQGGGLLVISWESQAMKWVAGDRPAQAVPKIDESEPPPPPAFN